VDLAQWKWSFDADRVVIETYQALAIETAAMVEGRVTLDGRMVVCVPSQIDDRKVLHGEKALVTVVVGSSHTL
jgi:hypothetical protein